MTAPRILTLLICVVAALPVAEAHAQATAACPMKKVAYTGDSPRVQRGSVEVGEVRYAHTVLLPDGYAKTNRRYAVLYLLHGAGGSQDFWLTAPATPRFLERLTEGEPVIVVLPDAGFLGMYSDWEGERGQQWETAHIDHLVPHIDRTYRTQARRSRRAVAGLSMGGMGALAYAARHTHLFGAAASFSGLVDTSPRSPLMKAFLTGAGAAMIPICTGSPKAFGPWGDPVLGANDWEAHNPTALAPRLRRTNVYVAAGDGVPCDEQDSRTLATEAPTNPLRAAEAFVHDAHRTFVARMREVGARVIVGRDGCGIHSVRYWERDLREWWPIMRRALRG